MVKKIPGSNLPPPPDEPCSECGTPVERSFMDSVYDTVPLCGNCMSNHLAEKTGKLLPSDPTKKSEVLQWLMFQMGGVGPMMGQANVFYRYFPEKLQSVIDRYQNESKRLFTVIDKHLQENQYLAQDFSIADIANWSWIRIHKWSGVEIEDLPNLKRWMDEISLRPACIKGVQIPRALELPDDENSEKIKEFEKNAKKILQK